MQTVCEQELFGQLFDKQEQSDKSGYRHKNLNPSELRLQWQVFLAGIVISGLMWLGIYGL